jgi:hypothetical protein
MKRESCPDRRDSAVTLGTHECHELSDLYRALVSILHGGEESSFTSFEQGRAILTQSPSLPGGWSWWGRVIFYVADVDDFTTALAAGCQPTIAPATPNG